MRPPNSTKSAVYQWNTALVDTCRQLGEFACLELVIAFFGENCNSFVRDEQELSNKHLVSLKYIFNVRTSLFSQCQMIFLVKYEEQVIE